ncbi:MAG: hypothetical protein ABI351_06950 [Herbaspirillum sp.]
MKSPVFILAAVALALPLATIAAESAPHDHGATPTKVELNAGKKWASDAPLRKAMNTIRQEVVTALPSTHAGKMTPEQYQSLSTAITGQIGYIVQNCKLDPKADAQLHAVLGQMTEGIDTLDGKQGDDRAAGVVKVAQSLNNYGTYFQHPGWKAVAISH